MTGTARRYLLWLGGALVLALLLSACGRDLPQDTFAPAGPTAQQEKDILFWPLVGAGFVFVLVEGGIVVLALKFRHRKGVDRMPTQLHGNTRLEIGWTIAPAVLIAVVFIPAISLIWDLARTPPDAMHITVNGYQWWWGFQYTDPDMAVTYGERGPITTSDVLVVPMNTTVDLVLRSAGGSARDDSGEPDHAVIHSLWVPKLFGKQDVIPGESGADNHIVFSAPTPGTYWGQCAEFCGLEHGLMRLRVRVLDDAAWQAWVASHKLPAASGQTGLAARGMDLFFGTGPSNEGGQCIACHTIGLDEQTVANLAAPDLTHFAAPEHECASGCVWEVFNPDGSPNKAALAAWLRNPSAVKFGAKMPNYHLTEDEIKALVEYLYTLT